jgi:hypothetical protein
MNTGKMFLKKSTVQWLCLLAASLLAVACRDDAEIFEPEVEKPALPDTAGNASSARAFRGFYLLNEGNMGSNKSTLDYYDFATGEYHRNIYAAANPGVPMELGDVGNDLQIYGGKLYAVINCSNKIEVMDRHTAKRLGQINIPNCRYIRFHGGYAYATSYAGPVEINPDYEQRGYVAKIDTATFQVLDRCIVGFQPDELEIAGGKIYVANSGGYMIPRYESTVSVIDLETFAETKRIEVAINLHRLCLDRHGTLWATSRGDYYSVPSRLFHIDTQTDICVGMLDVPVSGFCLSGDSLYIYCTDWSYLSMDNSVSYGIVDVARKEVVCRNFITDGTDGEIAHPYGIMVHPATKDIYLTDAANHVYPGAVICFDRNGKKKWQVRAGDIPAHFALLAH